MHPKASSCSVLKTRTMRTRNPPKRRSNGGRPDRLCHLGVRAFACVWATPMGIRGDTPDTRRNNPVNLCDPRPAEMVVCHVGLSQARCNWAKIRVSTLLLENSRGVCLTRCIRMLKPWSRSERWFVLAGSEAGDGRRRRSGALGHAQGSSRRKGVLTRKHYVKVDSIATRGPEFGGGW